MNLMYIEEMIEDPNEGEIMNPTVSTDSYSSRTATVSDA